METCGFDQICGKDRTSTAQNTPTKGSSFKLYVFGELNNSLDGETSNMFYFHPDFWGNDPI